ncbi:Wadjet anti-phage system protein JetD domain-containing protein [Bariatricus sp. SGI.154]|uniref:Wadjet anti-phage system protein JetD domain-containing protein n=1 Tax=Bariatricus sp. SGI.154 TaxID=3420549 RepID=UPI003D05C508
MAQYEKRILNALLDTYENSLLSEGKNKVTVHIAFLFTKRNIPEYFNESSMEYEEIHTCIKELEERGYLSIVWKRGKENHIVQKVLLNTNCVDSVYQHLQRMPKSENVRKNLRMLKRLGEQYRSPVVAALIRYLIRRLEENKSVKEYIELSECEKTRRLIQTVASIEENEEECYVREFSIRHFGDSKVFEDMLGIVGKVMRRFGSGYEEMDTHAILAEYSIYHTPNYVYLKGEGILYLEREEENLTVAGEDDRMLLNFGKKGAIQENRIDLGMMQQGIGLSGEDMRFVRIDNKADIKRVITIENLTTFFRWSEADSLIIYLGGYHNSLRRELLKMIYVQMPQAEYLHFGDIDVGGFEILDDLREKTGIDFQPYHMGIHELEIYEKYVKKLTVNDKKRLKQLIEKKKETSCEFIDVLQYMEEHEIKLEQECISV